MKDRKWDGCRTDRMNQICEGYYSDSRDIDYFIKNIKIKDHSYWFRLALNYDNYSIADQILELDYDINNDNRLLDDIIYYMDREMNEKIEYLFANGYKLDCMMMDRIEGSFREYNYYHTDDKILNDFKQRYRMQKIYKVKNLIHSKHLI